MMVFWQQKLVILATPKTGSTAIEAALEPLAALTISRPPVLKHTPAYRFRRFLAPYLRNSAGDDFTVVALMREPMSWLGSWYRFRQRDDVAEEAVSTRGMDFADFAEGYMQTPRADFADVGSQARFLTNKDGLAVDRLFRYEDLDAFVRYLEDILDFEIILPQLNVSPEAPLELPADVEQRLRDHMRDDFALYRSIPEKRHLGAG